MLVYRAKFRPIFQPNLNLELYTPPSVAPAAGVYLYFCLPGC